ncbi:MAG: ATP-grasp domain-containing protein [Proteobacteria bacterium]|nr:ATP-grasp domain-containing protein [Pseudomonadota bacterium]
MAKTLMIIGGGVEQIPAYEAAKKRGLIIVGTDVKKDAPALALADHVLIVSTRDAEATAESAVQFNKSHQVDGVMTIANDVPYTVALTSKKLGLHSISLEAAQCASDKLLMKQQFQKNDVPCPWFSPVENIVQLKDLTNNRDQETYVLKPVDGRGARGVLLLDDKIDLHWAFEESKRWGDSGRLILEKFIPGIQLSTESFILGDVCYTPAIAERNYSRLDEFKPYIIEDGGTIPAQLSDQQRMAIDDLILRGARSMGITDGIVKGDLVIDSAGNPLIIELAARLSGGWFASHEIPAATGVSLVDAVISYALGEKVYPEDLIPKWDCSTAIRYWFPESGRIKAISGEEILKVVPGLLQYGFFRKPGEMQPIIHMHPDRFGYVLVQGADREEAIARVEEAIACLHVEIE